MLSGFELYPRWVPLKTGSTTRPSVNLLGADGIGIPPVNVTKIRSSIMYVKQVITLMSAHDLKQ